MTAGGDGLPLGNQGDTWINRRHFGNELAVHYRYLGVLQAGAA
jgi:hypothetical protein